MVDDTIFTRRELISLGGAAASLSLAQKANSFYSDSPKVAMIGVNCYDLVEEVIKSGNLTRLKARFRILSSYGVKFVRFSMFSEIFFQLRVAPEKDVYLRALDSVFSESRASGVLLLPSLFWSYRELALAVNDGMSAWGDAQSATRRMAVEFIDLVLTRFGDARETLMWEIGNEMNSYVDVRCSGGRLGTCDGRLLTTPGLRSCLAELAGVVRAHSMRTTITSGNDMPRVSASSYRSGTVRRPDTPAEFKSNLIYVNPSPLNCASVHLYPIRHSRDFAPGATVLQITEWSIDACRNANKSLLIGEFGIPRGISVQEEINLFRSAFHSVVTSGVDYVALWVFDRTPRDTFNIAVDDYRVYQLQEVARYMK